MRVAVASDHAGLPLKRPIIDWLEGAGHEAVDFGTDSTEPVTALLGREHNDANMLAMGARIIGTELALACVAAFVAGEFEGGRHVRRIEKIAELEAAGG